MQVSQVPSHHESKGRSGHLKFGSFQLPSNLGTCRSWPAPGSSSTQFTFLFAVSETQDQLSYWANLVAKQLLFSRTCRWQPFKWSPLQYCKNSRCCRITWICHEAVLQTPAGLLSSRSLGGKEAEGLQGVRNRAQGASGGGKTSGQASLGLC